MNISQIKEKAKQLFVTCKPQYIRALTIVMLLTCLGSYLTELGFPTIINVLITVLFLVISHGYIVTSLKVTRHTAHTLSDDDALVGYKRFKDLFPTYVLAWLAEMGIVFLALFVLILVFSMIIGGMVLSIGNLTQFAYNDPTSTLVSLMTFAPGFIFAILLMVLIGVGIFYYVELYFFAVPYLLERFHMETGEAIKESFRFIKGHKMNLFKLDISFLGWILLYAVVTSLLNQFLGSLPFVGHAIVLLAGGFLQVYTYLPQYQLSRAIFFEEIAYQRYGGQDSMPKEDESSPQMPHGETVVAEVVVDENNQENEVKEDV